VRGLGPAPVDPYQGPQLLLVYLDGALVLASLAIVPGLALAVCLASPRRALVSVAGTWALASIALAALYPSPVVRGPGLARVYLAAELAGLFAAVAAIGVWARRRAPPSAPVAVALALVLADLAILLTPFSPWREGLFGYYDPAQLMILVLFSGLALVQGVLWRFSLR
jgi:hypothetical protein